MYIHCPSVAIGISVDLFRSLEERVAGQSASGNDVAINAYGISMTTLEEVFIRIGLYIIPYFSQTVYLLFTQLCVNDALNRSVYPRPDFFASLMRLTFLFFFFTFPFLLFSFFLSPFLFLSPTLATLAGFMADLH